MRVGTTWRLAPGIKVKPTFFATPSAFREWLGSHHAEADELWVGFYRKSSGRPSLTWPESVDEALCYGWIDGIRKSLDDLSYTIRFTPRRPGSIWSGVNIERAAALLENGQMQPAGLEAYEARRENKSGLYSYEQRGVELEEPYDRILRQNQAAWSFFQAQPPSYRKAVSWWIVSAKKEETRLKRLERLAAFSVQGRRLPELTPRKPAR
ncbi:MAG TPA: YdeI/OmpD-associated family protein [Thermoanaerobaculaceae bacterium]|nr:YdeI/OmpD-associated family protein [Thermoanaerobaculaceae bacterium]HPS78056.1 YdeI/OmpD-associated family protein [Thermoanaerobaculaceae bacterium]